MAPLAGAEPFRCVAVIPLRGVTPRRERAASAAGSRIAEPKESSTEEPAVLILNADPCERGWEV